MKSHISDLLLSLEALEARGIYVLNAITVQELTDRLLELNEQAEAIQSRADAEKRNLTEDEETEVRAIFAEFERVELDIKRREKIEAQANKLAQRVQRQTEAGQPGEPSNADNGEEARPRQQQRYFAEPKGPQSGKWGWRSFGEFAHAVMKAANKAPTLDPRLVQNAPTTYGNEGAGADGGYLVPPDFRQAIMDKVMAEESLLGRTDQFTTSSNTLVLPSDETTPWQTSGGIQAYWEDEASQLSQSKPSFKSNTLRLNKLTALVPVTEELMDDAPALDTYLRRKVPTKMDFAIQDAIINGTGAGKPLGILNAPCLVTQAKESGQAADTVVFENIVNMYSRMYGPCRQNAVWLINQDCEPQLMTMGFPTSATAVPVYLPPGGLASTPYGTLLGRPVIPVQGCQTVGDAGDIILADLTQYLTAVKTMGIRADVSMHLWFDYDTLAYRFIFRVAGMPWWAAAITPKNSSNTLSCFVALAARS